MVWLKLSDDFADSHTHLTDAEFRTHVEALAYVMRRETGPTFPVRDLRRFATSEAYHAAAASLCAMGVWATDGETYTVVDHMEHQPTPGQIEQRREADRVKKQRMRHGGSPGGTAPGDSRGVSGSGRVDKQGVAADPPPPLKGAPSPSPTQHRKRVAAARRAVKPRKDPA